VIDVLKPLIQQFMPFAKEKMGFSRPPRLFLRQDEQNGSDPMGKTGFYDPEKESITLYISGRHPKDVMRSLAHELQHHTQKCNGDFDNVQNMGEQGYAQADPHMRSMEIEAYQASIVFRDWEDSLKETIYYEHLQKGDKSSMSIKDWKNGELKSLLSEACPRQPRRMSGERGAADDCNPKTDPTCAPEPSEEAVADVIAKRMKKEDLNEMCPDMDPEDDVEDEGDDISVEDKAMLAMKAVHDLASAAGVDLHSQVSGPSDAEHEEEPDRLQEVVRRLHKAGFSPNQIKESLTNAFNKARKG
jgi:hypothetical protein